MLEVVDDEDEEEEEEEDRVRRRLFFAFFFFFFFSSLSRYRLLWPAITQRSPPPTLNMSTSIEAQGKGKVESGVLLPGSGDGSWDPLCAYYGTIRFRNQE